MTLTFYFFHYFKFYNSFVIITVITLVMYINWVFTKLKRALCLSSCMTNVIIKYRPVASNNPCCCYGILQLLWFLYYYYYYFCVLQCSYVLVFFDDVVCEAKGICKYKIGIVVHQLLYIFLLIIDIRYHCSYFLAAVVVVASSVVRSCSTQRRW